MGPTHETEIGARRRQTLVGPMYQNANRSIAVAGDPLPVRPARSRAASGHVELDVADPRDDVEVPTKPDNIGAQRVQPDGVTALDLADPRL